MVYIYMRKEITRNKQQPNIEEETTCTTSTQNAESSKNQTYTESTEN